MKRTPWYRWPENKRTGVVPWFVVLRRALFIVPLYALFATTAVVLACGWGVDAAVRFMRDNK